MMMKILFAICASSLMLFIACNSDDSDKKVKLNQAVIDGNTYEITHGAYIIDPDKRLADDYYWSYITWTDGVIITEGENITDCADCTIQLDASFRSNSAGLVPGEYTASSDCDQTPGIGKFNFAAWSPDYSIDLGLFSGTFVLSGTAPDITIEFDLIATDLNNPVEGCYETIPVSGYFKGTFSEIAYDDI